jgi:hypothetical protein
LVDYISHTCAVSLGVAPDGLPILATIDWRHTEAPEIDTRDLAYRACTSIAHLPKHVLSYARSICPVRADQATYDSGLYFSLWIAYRESDFVDHIKRVLQVSVLEWDIYGTGKRPGRAPIKV